MRGFAIAAAALLAPAAVTAQRLTPAFATVPEPWAAARAEKAAVAAFGHPDDYRWEGALAGAIGLGLLGGVFAAGFCGYGDGGAPSGGCVLQAVSGLLVGATVGVTVGGIVGSNIKKAKP